MSEKQLANPLQSLVAKAASKLPATTGESARFSRRYQSSGNAEIILCDVSSSMDESAGTRSKIAHLRDALKQTAQPHHTILAFASSVTMVSHPDELPAPSGGTALELGLRTAAQRRPHSTLVISDGQPNQPDVALREAEDLPGIINVIYCGPESDTAAIEFMRKLARVGCGRVVVHAWQAVPGNPSLADNVRLLLTR